MSGRAPRLLAAAAGALLAGCSAFPGAEAAGRRALFDGYVAVTAPIQVPAAAARDAWAACSGPDGASKAWLPVRFVGASFVHAGACALHLVDLLAAPIHIVAGNGPPRVYRAMELPLVFDAEANVGRESGELALYGVAGVGGAAIAWWFWGTYVPHLFNPFWL